MNKITDILSGSKQFPSDEIQLEIDTTAVSQATARENLASLDADLETKKLSNLGKPSTKEIKNLASERSDLSDNIITMGIALEKLKKAHTEAVNREIPAEIERVKQEINHLTEQKNALMPEVLKKCGEAAALFFQIRGRINFEMGPRLGPNNLLSQEDQQVFFETWQTALEDKPIFPNEIDRLSFRHQELLIQARQRGI